MLDSLKFGWDVANVDLGTQGFTSDKTNIHCMSAKGQECEDAINQCEAMINNVRRPLHQRVHTAQDRVTPQHRGKPWTDDIPWLKRQSHKIDEYMEGVTLIYDGRKVTRALLKKNR